MGPQHMMTDAAMMPRRPPMPASSAPPRKLISERIEKMRTGTAQHLAELASAGSSGLLPHLWNARAERG